MVEMILMVSSNLFYESPVFKETKGLRKLKQYQNSNICYFYLKI